MSILAVQSLMIQIEDEIKPSSAVTGTSRAA
jgi:hypothetical protein